MVTLDYMGNFAMTKHQHTVTKGYQLFVVRCCYRWLSLPRRRFIPDAKTWVKAWYTAISISPRRSLGRSEWACSAVQYDRGADPKTVGLPAI